MKISSAPMRFMATVEGKARTGLTADLLADWTTSMRQRVSPGVVRDEDFWSRTTEVMVGPRP